MAKSKKKEYVVQTDMSDIRMMTYDGELWYNAADLMKHLSVLFESMREINGLVGELDDTIKKRLK